MANDNPAARLITPTRAEIRDQYKRNYRIRLRGADTRDGTQPAIDAEVFADTAIALYANAVTIANNTSRRTKTGSALDDEAKALGTQRLGAEGASGFVSVRTSQGGGWLVEGTEGTIASIRYACASTALYRDGDPVPVGGIDTGSATDQPPGATLAWTSPPPGIGPTATVIAQGDGSGLKGGHEVESDDELRDRLDYLAANPPASGNDAEYQALVRRTPGVPVEAAFTYPAILGPGTMGIVFTVRPARPGASRTPNAEQTARVLAWLKGQMPADDVILMGALSPTPITVALRVTFAPGSPGWMDIVPYPTYASPMTAVRAATAPTVFRLMNVATPPTPGRVIAFYDSNAERFRRKTILTAVPASGSGEVDIVCDTANGASDTSYAPYAGQPCCPWSESLDLLAPPLLAEFARLGPGEQRAYFFDPGLRQRRSPASPQFWPSVITNRTIAPLFTIGAVQDVVLQEPAIPFATPIGLPGASSNLLRLQTIVAFPQ